MTDFTGALVGFARLQMAREMAREAAASVALSHTGGCMCIACRATRGDEEALAEVLELLDGER